LAVKVLLERRSRLTGMAHDDDTDEDAALDTIRLDFAAELSASLPSSE
jgi:hypothetical protein